MFETPLPLPTPANEPVLSYAPGSPERAGLKSALAQMAAEQPEIPHVIGGREVREGGLLDVVAPHARRHVLARIHDSSEGVTGRAIEAAQAAAPAWAAMRFDERARVFLKAADLLAGPWRATLNAATMLGQSKTAFQAEIDAACELIDFLRFNVAYASRLLEQPISPPGLRNTLELRPLEGFVLAVTPFNFTAIAGNLPTAPALLGNVVVWKPAETQSLAAYHTMRLLQAAGLPEGVINVVYGRGEPVGRVCLAHPSLAGLHFTGSTATFQALWRGISDNLPRYRSYPRVVGETGGKDFVFAHPSAEVAPLAAALVRGAYEFQGQKCSAASRAYLPRSLWPALRDRMVDHIATLRMGDVTDFRNFLGAVIDDRAFQRLAGWQQRLAADGGCTVLAGGKAHGDDGFFIEPTLVQVADPRHPVMSEELFGPLLSVFVYDDEHLDEALALCESTSPYGLTGAIFSQDRAFLARASRVLLHAAGNLYLNDKPTGAVVGQQPFGGGRSSGTNDKAGSALNLLRWVSPRTIKETFVPPTSVLYPFQQEP